MAVELDKPVADFQAPATSGQQVQLSALKGQQVVLYFYPKDSTPGCTTEGQGFRDKIEAFAKANTVIFGVSRDGPAEGRDDVEGVEVIETVEARHVHA